MKKFLRYWHRWKDLAQFVGYIILLFSVLSGLWIGFTFITTANATADSVVKIKEKDRQRDDAITRMDYNIQLIARKMKLPLLTPNQ